MSYACLHFDAKTTIARTSIGAWNALMRADPEFGRYALSDAGRSAFLVAFTVQAHLTWWVGGQLHRIGGPAFTPSDGGEYWYEHGKLHRIGGPAVVYANGSEAWYECGRLHRTDGPAITYANGDAEWFEHGGCIRVRHNGQTYQP